jgi:hypothetical protein
LAFYSYSQYATLVRRKNRGKLAARRLYIAGDAHGSLVDFKLGIDYSSPCPMAWPSALRRPSPLAEWGIMSVSQSSRFDRNMRALSALAAMLVAVTLYVTFPTPRAKASGPIDNYGTLTSIAAAPNGGYWVQVDAKSNAIPLSPSPSVAHRTSAASPSEEPYWRFPAALPIWLSPGPANFTPGGMQRRSAMAN